MSAFFEFNCSHSLRTQISIISAVKKLRESRRPKSVYTGRINTSGKRVARIASYLLMLYVLAAALTKNVKESL